MKKFLLFILTMSLVFSLVGCGIEIEDTNGEDDYSLNTITDDNIISLDLGASTYSTSVDERPIEFKANNFSGVAEIFSENYFLASSIEIQVTSVNVNAGNLRLVVVCDDEIVHDFDINTTELQQYLLEDVKGSVSVRVAGESADCKIYVDVY